MNDSEKVAKAIEEASEILALAGVSHIICTTKVVDTVGGRRVLPINAVVVEEGQSLNLLESMWMGLGRFFHSYYEGNIPESHATLFAHGCAVSESVASVLYAKGQEMEESLMAAGNEAPGES
jgi:hypothetical protein